MAEHGNDLSPVAAKDRIYALDVIRGFAVLGILAVNAMSFAWPEEVMVNPGLQPGYGPSAAVAWQLVDVFFLDKMRTLFSMLFGVSIYLFGGEVGDAARGRLLAKRLGWLALFGAIHGLFFWFGDILLLYALAGFGVMFFRSWSARTLLIVGVAGQLVSGALFVGMMGLLTFLPPELMNEIMASEGWAKDAAGLAARIEMYRGDALSVTGRVLLDGLETLPVNVFLAPMAAFLMFIGLGLFKAGFFAGRWPVWAYGLCVAAGAASLWLIWREAESLIAQDFSFAAAAARPAGSLLGIVVSIAYAAVLVLAVRFGLRALLYPLACAGRMAFTNYLTQTVIMTTIFYGGRGLGWYGQIGWPQMWLVIGAVWTAQLVWSVLWLQVFQMGPLEWVWRRLTYGRALPIRKAAPA